MKNKVLIKVVVPEFDRCFDVFIPVNEILWKVKRLVVKSISDITGIELDPKGGYILINKEDSKMYDDNSIIIDTDIRNGTEVILLSKK